MFLASSAWQESSRNVAQHENARPHTSLRTWEHITKMGWTVLPYPSYSPDLAPLDFHLFGSLKDALCGTHFADDNSIIEAVRKWLCRQDKIWYRQGIHALVPRWRKAVQADGDYVEKNSVCYRNIHLYCQQISTILNKYILRKKMWGKTF
jgi:hypothetical protein